ncbi:N-acetylmuramoyl-L-alanine amidase family protein [Hungatella effluvii]|uniref:N-acetylmuramoyl-L-alanine amidase family protein n=1 Tax=Hungatella effluvii TaxID=1096246 RepID=UPI0022E05F5C|nr:hypothetical protein [Hungatella effluvii]
MKGRKIAAIVLSSAIIVSGMGTVTMAEGSTKVQQEVQTVQKASDSNAEKNQDTNKEEKQEVNQARSNKEKKASSSDATYVSTEEQLREAVGHDGEIVLESEISLTEPLYISGNISMEGEEITFAGDRETCKWPRMIAVNEGAKVTLRNITIDGTGFDRNDKLGDRWKDYYVIETSGRTEITLEDGADIITNDTTLLNPRKGGMWVSGTCYMKGGTVSGFSFGDDAGGIKVDGKFEMTGGLLTQNWHGLLIVGEFQDREEGCAYVTGGAITENVNGVFSSGYFEMNGGEITGNETGVFNNNYDALADQKFSPLAKLSGGEIADNVTGVWNKDGGTVIVGGTVEINGQWIDESLFRSMVTRSDIQSKAIIRNENQSTLNIAGGTINTYDSNEIAIFNDNTSKLYMTDGTITSAGIAIRNENPTAGQVKLSNGTIQLIGTEGKAIDNLGYLEATSGLMIESENNSQYLIAVSHNEGGKISPSTSVESAGEKIHFEFKPDSGYKILNVTLDGELKGAVSTLDITVEHAHEVKAEFEKIQSSGSGSSGGSGSGSSRTTVASSTKIIPETPGSWIQDQTGWKFITGAVPYNNTWIRKNNAWYWVGEDGYMKTGWNLISEKWYYLMPVSGEMKTGWIADGGNWYYTDETGARLTGWVKTGDKWYYLNADGKMAFSTTTPDGYQVDENGVMIG